MKTHWTVWGCLIPSASLLAISLILLAAAWYFTPGNTIPEYIRKNEKQVEQRIARLTDQAKNPAPAIIYDPDTTISALYGMEQAFRQAKTFEDLTSEFILQNGSDRVSPDVQLLKYRFFNIYKKILREKDTLAESESLYSAATGGLLEFFSVFDPVTLTVDRAQARKLLQERTEKAALSRETRDRLRAAQDELMEFVFDYMAVSSRHYREWDNLCSYRDRAYLACFESKWDEAILNADAAARLAPYETEAHILLGMALLERGNEADRAVARSVIDQFVADHPVHAAGFLLRGVLNMKENKMDQAVIDFDQSAAYFPKLQEQVNDRLGIYRKRTYLNRSMEGRVIVNAYRAMMAGSGYFSPDFQKARIYVSGKPKETVTDEDRAKAKEKVFAHFFRRRQQGEWDKVLDDFKFSSRALDTDLFCITSGGVKLDINIEEAFFFNKVILKVTNNGSAPLKNLTMLLCVRFTDMFKNDYVSFPVGDTVAVLPPGKTVEVGRRDISELTERLFGTRKKFKDIIEYAAVLISDEAISWIEAKDLDNVLPDPDPDSAPVPATDGKNAADNAESVRKIVDALSEKASGAAAQVISDTLKKTAEKVAGSASSAPEKTASSGK